MSAEPSPELVEEIARVMADARSEHLLAYNEDQPIWKFIARAVLSSPSIARALDHANRISAEAPEIVTQSDTRRQE